ncbi:MAG: hypothetical protein PHD48_05495, partial [Alphaproteobacteria bacterium]|nr:hypothetical protein [Alphaproteobacteria bacterium]
FMNAPAHLTPSSNTYDSEYDAHAFQKLIPTLSDLSGALFGQEKCNLMIEDIRKGFEKAKRDFNDASKEKYIPPAHEESLYCAVYDDLSYETKRGLNTIFEHSHQQINAPGRLLSESEKNRLQHKKQRLNTIHKTMNDQTFRAGYIIGGSVCLIGFITAAGTILAGAINASAPPDVKAINEAGNYTCFTGAIIAFTTGVLEVVNNFGHKHTVKGTNRILERNKAILEGDKEIFSRCVREPDASQQLFQDVVKNRRPPVLVQ